MINDWNKLTRQAEVYKKAYPAGTRVVLEQMGDDPRPIPPGTRGTVDHVDDIGTVHCNFDNGRHLGMVPGEDSFRKLTEKELESEVREKGELDCVDNLISAAEKIKETKTVFEGEDSPRKYRER